MSLQPNQNKLFISALSRLVAGLERNGGRHQVYRPEKSESYPSGRRNAAGPHYHESWELKITVKGVVRCRFENQTFDLKNNSVLLVAPQAIHYETEPLDVRGGLWLNCLFENGDVRLMLTEGRRIAHYFLSLDQKTELTDLLGRPANEFCEHAALVLGRTKDQSGHKMANAWLAIFFRSLLSALAAPPVSSPRHEIVSRAISVLNTMSDDPSLTVARMSKLLNISQKYLSVVFSRLTGVSPRQKLIRIRLERAYRQLQTGRFTVKEVAALTGWQNQFYFSNSFHRHYGMAPSQVPVRADKKNCK